MKKINVLKNNPSMEGQMKLVQNIIYSKAGGEELPMTLFLPWNLDNESIKKEKKPLIVFVQGSAGRLQIVSLKSHSFQHLQEPDILWQRLNIGVH